MNLYRFDSELWLPRAREEVFEFFADARNLEKLTPAFLRFEVITPSPIRMQPGARIGYRLRVHGLPLRWESEITAWEPPHRLVDEQRRGPYRSWRHEHRFEEHDGGTLCVDEVDYSVPGGGLVHRLFVRRDVEAMFRFRRQKLIELFGDSQSGKF